jgi:hypothetical protein
MVSSASLNTNNDVNVCTAAMILQLSGAERLTRTRSRATGRVMVSEAGVKPFTLGRRMSGIQPSYHSTTTYVCNTYYVT